jgi:uncharacterized protein
MFRRPDERSELRFHAEQGRSILMLAPRRIGKTWLIDRFADDLRAAGWLAIRCDVQDLSTEADVLRHLCLRIEEQGDLLERAEGRTRQIISQLFSKDHSQGWRKTLGQTDWKSFAETLVRGLNERDQPTMILIDELALFVAAMLKKNVSAAREFLYGLRALQQAYPKVRWLFTGSIGLDTIARRGDIAGALVNLHPFTLEPFGVDAARAFIEHLCTTGQIRHPFVLDSEALSTFVKELGWLAPFYVEKLALLIRPSGTSDELGRRAATSQDVATAFDVILGGDYRMYFITWEEHLSKNFKAAEAAFMRRVLDVCGRAAGGEQLDTILARMGQPPTAGKRKALRDATTILVADGYLTAEPDGDRVRYRFRSGLLRRYWQRYLAE